MKTEWYNGIYDRYEYPVLTREFAPVHWRYDLDKKQIRISRNVSASTQ